MAQWVFNALSAVASPVMVSANRSLAEYRKLAPGYVFEDAPELFGQGPLAGLLTGMKQASLLGAHAVLVSPCDTPEIVPKVFSDLIYAWRQAPEKPVVVMCEGRIHPLHGVYPVALAPLLEQQLESGNRRVMVFARAAGVETLNCTGSADAFKNRNRPEDFHGGTKSGK